MGLNHYFEGFVKNISFKPCRILIGEKRKAF